METQIYKMKRYESGIFAKIKSTEEEKQKVIDLLKRDFREEFVNEIVRRFVNLKNEYSYAVSTKFPNSIYDVIYMENDITYKGGIIAKDPDTLSTYDGYDKVNGDSFCFIYDPDDGKFYDTSYLGYGSGHNRLYDFNENRALFLRPSMEPFYGLFPGIYEFPYCHRTGASLQWYGVYPTDVFIIDGEQYAIGYNNGVGEYGSSTNLMKMFLYKLMLD